MSKTPRELDIYVDRVGRDMHHRIALWSLMNDSGFEPPPREPLTKSEMVEEERLQTAIAQAGHASSAADLAQPVRSVKVRVSPNI